MKSKRARQESTSDSDASEDSVLSVDNSSESEDSGSSSEDLKRSKKKKKRAASSESDSDSETHHKRSAKKRKHKKKKKKHSKKKRRHESHEESDVEITSASDGEVYIRKRHKHHKHKHSSKGPKKSHDSSAKDSEKYEYRDDGNKEQRYYSTVQSVVKDKHVSSVENISSDEDRELKSHRSHASEKYFSKDYNYRREEAKPRDVGPSRGRHHDVDGDRRVEEMHRFYRGSSKDRTRSADGRDREREPFPYDRTQHKKFDADKPGVRYDKDSYEQKYSERYQGGYQGQGYQKSRHQDYGVTESRTCPEKVDNRYQQSRPDRYDNPRPSNDMDMQRHKPRYDDDYRGKDRGYNSRYNANSGPPSDSRYDPKPSVQHRDYQNRQYQSNQSSFRNDRDYYNKGQKEDIRSIPRLDSVKLDNFEPRFQEPTRTERAAREPERPKRRSPANSKSSRGEGKSRSPNGHSREKRRKRSEEGDKDYEWGKSKEVEVKKEPVEKEKPNFGLSGKLTEDTNMVNGVVLKYSEPDDAKQPKRKWRFYPFKGDKALPILYIHRQSCFLLGRDRAAADIALEHPSVSKQHAALQYRAVAFTREDGSVGRRIRPYIIDLESANGTFVNNKKIDPRKYVELLERDVVKFGFSQRDYVLLHENSKDDAMDDDCQQNEVGVKVENVKSEKV